MENRASVNVLIVDYTWGIYGGPEEVLYNLERDLKLLGIPTRVVVEKASVPLWMRTYNNLDWADVVVSFTFPSSLILTRKPQVWVCYDAPEEYYRWYKVPLFIINRWIWRRQGRYMVCSNYRDAHTVEVIYRRKIDHIIPGFGVDYDFYSDGIRIYSDKTPFRICQVGTILRLKNQLGTVDIFSEFVKKVPNSILVLAGPRVWTGSGPRYWDAVEEKIKHHNLEDKVLMPGHLTREQVRELYYNSDVYLHPVTGTGGWLPPFEALSTALPVVTTKKFFGWEYLSDYGVVCDNCVEGLLRVYNDRDGYTDKALEGSRWVKENFTSMQYTQKLLEVIKEAYAH